MAFKRTLKDRQDFNYARSKEGSEATNPNTGEVYKINDFQRGRYFGRAESIKNKRYWFKKKMENDPKFKAEYEKKQKEKNHQ